MDTGPFSDEQVIHDENQIRNPEELVVGETYQLMSDLPGETSRITRSLTIVSLDRVDEEIVRVKRPLPIAILIPGARAESGEEDLYLNDAGLRPYNKPEGKWNSHYWLMRK